MSWLTVAVNQIRAPAVLTNSYVFTGPIDCKNLNQLTLLTNFTLGSLTSMSWKAQFSQDNTNWYDQEIDNTQALNVSGNEAQVPALSFVREFSANSSLAINVPVKAPYVRIAVEGVGTVTGSSCDITVCYGVG